MRRRTGRLLWFLCTEKFPVFYGFVLPANTLNTDAVVYYWHTFKAHLYITAAVRCETPLTCEISVQIIPCVLWKRQLLAENWNATLTHDARIKSNHFYWSHCHSRLYDLCSKWLFLSLDPRCKRGKTCHTEKKTFNGKKKLEETSERATEEEMHQMCAEQNNKVIKQMLSLKKW